MKIRVGYELIYDFPQPTPIIMVLGTHFTRASDVIVPDHLTTSPAVPISPYRDGFGNWCSRILAPAGRIRLSADGVVRDRGLPDPVAASARQHAVQDLPAETLTFLLGSRYCETDRLSEVAWQLFGHSPPGWARVQAICDFVHCHVAFGYEHAHPTKTAWEVFNEGKGVCRDYAHLAIALCRCMNIPARYCTGYLGDIGVPPPHGPMDFCRLVRGLSRRAVVRVRPAQQRAAHRPRADRAGARRRRRADHPYVRAQYAGELQGLDRRDLLTFYK
jgi:transglutaminase-like putative cysteine protease